MIYLLAIGLIITAFGFIRRVRRRGFVAELINLATAAVAGLCAGIFIGIGARIGMAAIAFANNDAPRVSLSGTFQVIALFTSFGILCGVIYEAVFRDLLRNSGLAYGVLLTLCLWYPLGEAAAEVLNFTPSAVSMIIWSGVFVALMWIPFGVFLEYLLSRFSQRGERLFVCRHA